MAIPKYDEMYREFLEALADGKERKIGEIRDILGVDFKVTEEERKQLLSSGTLLFNNRVNWTCNYLKKAGLVENAARGVYRITDMGRKVFRSNPKKLDNEYLMQIPSFREYLRPDKDEDTADHNQLMPEPLVPKQPESLSGQSPQDILDEAFQKINDTLAEDVLSEVMKQTPIFFEHLVVRLLTQMGYGGSLENAGTVTKASGDEGIDGIIREDKLGFNKIYIQAKRWDLTSTVGRPELQKFVGALAGQGATKGLFITTARFSREARDYADKQHTTKIVLVDGPTLARLMIEYGVGVSVEATYAIKKIDSDFFDDDLF